MNKKYIAPQVNTTPLDNITPLMAGSTGQKTLPVSEQEVDEQGAKPNMNPFAPDTDDNEQKKSIWE